MKKKDLNNLLGATFALLMSACAVGPDYERPPVDMPAAYKEALSEWKQATPRDEENRGAWWAVYRDDTLDVLEQQVETSNQNIKAAEAAVRMAQAALDQARASFLPTIGAEGSSKRAVTTQSPEKPRNTHNVAASAAWSLDLWGRIRRTVESEEASAQVSQADLAGAKLSVQSLVAMTYFQLRAQDELQGFLDTTVEAYERSLKITKDRYEIGMVSRSDQAAAQAQLESAKSQAIAARAQRAKLEHALAVLVGKAPADFSLPAAPLAQKLPNIPAEVPSALLERRPDIAAAERQMAAANAQIGVALSAYFPDITLSASYGYTGAVLDKLIKSSANVWSVGPAVAMTLFDAGARSAQVDSARAAYDQTVALYRQTVLTALQEVEDQLVTLRTLKEQLEVENAAVEAAQESLRLAMSRYKEGVADYTAVIVAQTAALSSERSALTVRQNLIVTSVGLIQALGGGWTTAQLQ